MSPAGPSSISSSSLLALKALTAEHKDRFDKEGRTAVKGLSRRQIEKSKDPFDRPSPGLVKRLAAEARNDAKRRIFQEDGLSEEDRRLIMEAKARRYEALQRGDFSGISEKELSEAAIDFERKADEWSEHSSDVDESAEVSLPRPEDRKLVEYVDELGRTRLGTRAEAKEAASIAKSSPAIVKPDQSAYAEVLESNVIRGDQNIFPVYQPDPEALKAKYREAEEASRAHHYDSTKEVRTRGAGQYQFSLDEDKRAEQMASLQAERRATERARDRHGLNSAIRDERKRKLDARQALIEQKRIKFFGSAEALARARAAVQAEEADMFLASLEQELGGSSGVSDVAQNDVEKTI